MSSEQKSLELRLKIPKAAFGSGKGRSQISGGLERKRRYSRGEGGKGEFAVL